MSSAPNNKKQKADKKETAAGDIKKRLETIIEHLNKGLVDREEHIKLALLTMLSGENLILIGPPGTAKSEIARRLNSIIKGGNYFEYLLTKFTTPEELFGPLSIKELEKDRFKRQTESYLPQAHIGFLDEIFKANSAILNSLLTLVNERLFHNGAVKEETELLSIISASNELPIGDSELEALYDRFLTRIVVDNVGHDRLHELIYADTSFNGIAEELSFSVDEIKEFHEMAALVQIPDNIARLLISIKKELDDELQSDDGEDEESGFERISDRRFKKAIKLLKSSAYSNGRDVVNLLDVSLLYHCFWNSPEKRDRVKEVVLAKLPVIEGHEAKKIKVIYNEWLEKFNKVFSYHKVNSDGNELYIDSTGMETTDSKNRYHEVDKNGKYIYKDKYNGSIISHSESRAEYPRNNDYKAVYKFSKNKPLIAGGYQEYIKAFDDIIPKEFLPSLEPILSKVKEEYDSISKIYQTALQHKGAVESDYNSHIWINKEDLADWKRQSLIDFEKTAKIEQNFKKLLDNVQEACGLAQESQDEYVQEIAGRR